MLPTSNQKFLWILEQFKIGFPESFRVFFIPWIDSYTLCWQFSPPKKGTCATVVNIAC